MGMAVSANHRSWELRTELPRRHEDPVERTRGKSRSWGEKCGRLLVLTLLGTLMKDVRAKVTGNRLSTPWTEAEHSQLCGTKPVPCPLLTLSHPAVTIRSLDKEVLLRNVDKLSESDKQKNATLPFFIYDYSPKGASVKTYKVTDSTKPIKITFNMSMGRIGYNSADLGACKCNPCVTSEGALGQEATLETGPLSFSIIQTIPVVNCVLRSISVGPSGRGMSSESQLAQYGAMSTLTVLIQSAPGQIDAVAYDYEVSTVIYYEEIVYQPKVQLCPTFDYPYPNNNQLSGLPYIDQPVRKAGWTRSDLQRMHSGLCWSNPVKSYPAQQPPLSCKNASYSQTQYAPTCTLCGVTDSAWFYVLEDSPTVMTLSGMRFDDGSFFAGSAEMTMELLFGSHAPNSQASRPQFTAQSESVESCDTASCYCAFSLDPDPLKKCASSSLEAFNKIWVPETGTVLGKDYKIRIVNQTRQARMCKPGTADCPTRTTPVTNIAECIDPGDGTGDSIWCPCKSGLCYTVNSPTTASSRLVDASKGRSRLWFEMVESSTGLIMQIGYFDLSVSLTENIATGYIHSYPSSMGCQLSNRQRCPNWFRFSPMSITGSYKETLDANSQTIRKLTISTRTDSERHPSLSLTVQSDFGLIHFPNALSSVTRDPLQPAKKVQLVGNLRDLTITLSKIQYQVDHASHPNLNTQTKGRASSDHLKIVYDKGQSFKDLYDPGNVGAITVFDFPVTILATNDAPGFNIPQQVNATENQIARVANVSIFDVDGEEVLVDSADKVPTGVCPSAPDEAHHAMILTLSSKMGKLYANITGIDSIPEIFVRDSKAERLLRQLAPSTPRALIQKLLKGQGDIRCGLDDRLLCVRVPSQYLLSRQDGGSEVIVFTGAARIKITGTLPCLNQALKSLHYMGMEDYNNNVPSLSPADKTGCPAETVLPPEREYINMSIQDNSTIGCVEDSGKIATIALPVFVEAKQQNLVIRSPDLVEALEGVPFSFTSYACEQVGVSAYAKCGAIQVLTRDNGDVTLLTRPFRITLSVNFGTLNIKEKLGTIAFLVGNGTEDKVVQMQGTLCEINVALRTMMYKPDKDFATEYNIVNKTWSPAANKEEISILVEQPSSDGSRKIGPDSRLMLPVSVKGVDKAPTMTIIMPGTSDTVTATPAPSTGRRSTSTVKFALKSSTADIFFCGGNVSCQCPSTALACVKVEDPDSCDAKFRAGVSCDSRLHPNTNPRLVIRSDSSDLWFFDGDVIGTWVAGVSCTKSMSIPVTERQVNELSAYKAGRNLHSLDIFVPLPLIQSGVLRIWASRVQYGSDSIHISMQGAPPATGINVLNTPLEIQVENTWCATLNPAVCVDADVNLAKQTLQGGVTGPVIIVLGLMTAGAIVLLVIGLSPGAGISKIMQRTVGHTAHKPEKVQEIARLQESITDFYGDDNPHLRDKGQWVMARDNRRRPFWFHTVTRQTSRIDPASVENFDTMLMSDTNLDSIVARQSVEELLSPFSLDKDQVEEHDQEMNFKGSYRKRDPYADHALQRQLQHPETGETFTLADINPQLVKVDFPGAWNAQADVNDMDNSLVTAMLLTKSTWIRDQDKAGKVTAPLQDLVKEHHEKRQEQQQNEQRLRLQQQSNGILGVGSASNGSMRLRHVESPKLSHGERARSKSDDEHLVAI